MSSLPKEKKPTIIRKAKGKTNPFAQISRKTLQNKNLSWQATGLLAYILSLPDTWELNLQDLSNRKTNGRAATRTALKELLEAGYIEKQTYRDKKGKFVRYEYIAYEEPKTLKMASKPLKKRPLSNNQIVDTIYIQNNPLEWVESPHEQYLARIAEHNWKTNKKLDQQAQKPPYQIITQQEIIAL